MEVTHESSPSAKEAPRHHTILIAVVAILALGLVSLVAWLIVTSDSGVSPEDQATQEQQAALMAVVTANLEALNAQSADGLSATFTADATVSWTDEGTGQVVSMSAEEYVEDVSGFVPMKEAFTGDPAFSGDLHVAIPTQRIVAGQLTENGIMHYTLVDEAGQLKIDKIEYTFTTSSG